MSKMHNSWSPGGHHGGGNHGGGNHGGGNNDDCGVGGGGGGGGGNAGGGNGGGGGGNGGNPSLADGGDCDSLIGATITADVALNSDIGFGDCSLLNLDGLIGLDLDIGADLGLV